MGKTTVTIELSIENNKLLITRQVDDDANEDLDLVVDALLAYAEVNADKPADGAVKRKPGRPRKESA